MTPQEDEAWTPGTPKPALAAGEIHVWMADMGALPQALESLLQAGERRRAGTLLSSRLSTSWMRCRGLLRLLLGEYTGQEPAALRIEVGPNGKPYLGVAGGGDSGGGPEHRSGRPISFNLSHSSDRALMAFSASGSLGVDLEAPRPVHAPVAFAARALGAAEAARIEALDPDLRSAELLRSWTRHEATLKCLGAGIGAEARQALGPDPWVADIELEEGWAAALAAEREPGRLCRWRWVDQPGAGSVGLAAIPGAG